MMLRLIVTSIVSTAVAAELFRRVSVGLIYV